MTRQGSILAFPKIVYHLLLSKIAGAVLHRLYQTHDLFSVFTDTSYMRAGTLSVFVTLSYHFYSVLETSQICTEIILTEGRKGRREGEGKKLS